VSNISVVFLRQSVQSEIMESIAELIMYRLRRHPSAINFHLLFSNVTYVLSPLLWDTMYTMNQKTEDTRCFP